MRFKLMMVALGAGLLLPTAASAQIDLMQFADGNGDGKVTMEEYAAFSQQTWSYFAHDTDKVKMSDLDPTGQAAMKGVPTDAEGYITKAAFLASTAARFKAADKDGNGTLSAAELNASMGS